MILVQTIVVYAFMIICMYYLSKYTISKSNNVNYIFMVSMIYALVMGMRYGVGVDYYSYRDMYEYWNFNDYKYDEYIEPGYGLLMSICKLLGFSTPLFFFTVSFIQLFLILLVFKDVKGSTQYICLAFILTGIGILSFTNGIRQCLAFSLFVFSLRYISGKKFLSYIIVILIAASFHKSALLLLPMYFVGGMRFKFLDSKLLAVVPAVSVIIMYSGVGNDFLQNFDALISMLDYDRYLNRSDMMDSVASLGLTDILYLIVNTSIILSITDIYSTFSKHSLILRSLYIFWLIGVVGETVFKGSMMMQRLFLYFVSLKFIMIGIYLLYLIKTKNIRNSTKLLPNKMYLFYFTVFTLYFRFSRILANAYSYTADYVFYFQENLHFYKQTQI